MTIATTKSTPSDGSYFYDAMNFDDIPIQTMPYPSTEPLVTCPKCHGHGYWNLRLNAYGPGKHFQALCSQCMGWGRLTAADAACVHDWAVTRTGRCLVESTCTKCGKGRVIDSSD